MPKTKQAGEEGHACVSVSLFAQKTVENNGSGRKEVNKTAENEETRTPFWLFLWLEKLVYSVKQSIYTLPVDVSFVKKLGWPFP